MLCIELPSGACIDFESAEAMAIAMQRMREGKPIIIKREDGIDEVLWAPEDDRHRSRLSAAGVIRAGLFVAQVAPTLRRGA